MIFAKINYTKFLLGILISGVFIYFTFDLNSYFSFDLTGIEIGKQITSFVTTFRSIIIQAFPFVLLGVLISIIVELFIKAKWLLRLLPKNRILSHLFISFFGILMPVCECGNVPVARRLILKGFSVSQSVTFLLSAPIINPVTIFATWEAFHDPVILITRIGGGLLIANLVGIVLSFYTNQSSLLSNKLYAECKTANHEHSHKSKLKQALDIFQSEFTSVFIMLLIGAFIASLTQVFISREIILGIGQNPLLSIIAMILFSLVISVCSSVDAFVVLPYVGIFSTGSILAYLIFGPMIDLKILTILKASFKTKLLIILTVQVSLMVILIGSIVNFFI